MTSLSQNRFVRFAWMTLGANLAVILWGAYVRATGSGAGCGSDWPLCQGKILPRDPSVATLIEYSHRLTSGAALLLVVGLVVWAFRAFPPGHPARRGAVASLFLIFAEAGIGAGLVLFELVADNASMARALFMATHLGNTFLLLAALVLTAFWGAGGDRLRWRGQGTVAWLLAATLAATLVVGMSGAVAALGDTLFPSGSLAEGLRQDLSATSHVLIRLRTLHPLLAVGASLLILYLVGVLRKERRGPAVYRHLNLLTLLVFVQLGAGAVNVALLAPVWLQLVHLLLADMVWITLVLTTAVSLRAGATSFAADPLLVRA